MLYAIQYIRPMNAGWTNPQLLRCSDGNKYVVKLMNNPLGLRVLPNELIAYRLGSMLGLPVAECTVIHISDELIDLFPALTELNVNPGPHLGCRYFENAVTLQDSCKVSACTNLAQASGMIVFDHWIDNWDRHWEHAKNILKVGDRMVLIDHANAFNGPDWTIDSLCSQRNEVTVYWGKIYEMFVPYLDNAEPFEVSLTNLASLSKSDIRETMVDIPEEWEIASDELTELADFLYVRKSFVPHYIQQLQQFFPLWAESVEQKSQRGRL